MICFIKEAISKIPPSKHMPPRHWIQILRFLSKGLARAMLDRRHGAPLVMDYLAAIMAIKVLKPLRQSRASLYTPNRAQPALLCRSS
jgi:hypothetical protein